MKTLEELENDIIKYGISCHNFAQCSACGATAKTERLALFASLAQWDAILQECLPELKQEIKSLEWMQNTRNEEDLSEDIGLSPKNTARLAHLRELIGEEGEER